MALIGEIRKRSWLLIVMIGLGMGGFLLMDMIGNNSSFGNPNLMGKIGSRKILSPDFYNAEIKLYGESPTGDQYQRRDLVWNYLIEETIVGKLSNKLGIGVSDEELNELFTVGPNISPMVVEFFGGYQNFDVQQYNQIKSQAESFEGQDKVVWDNLTNRVILDRKKAKYVNLMAQAVYTPTWMAEMDNAEKTQTANFKFVGVPFASVADEEITVTDGDLKKYIQANAYKYQKDEETRKASYVVFDVIPTAEDSATVRQKIADLTEGFANAEDDSLFITENYGIFEQSYNLKDDLSPVIADSMFKVPVGTVVGPYQEGRKYKAVKLVDRMVVPDSVNARHILLTGESQPGIRSIQDLRKLADSLKTVLSSGSANFDSLAVKFSKDDSNKDNGGKLDWATTGKYVKPFENMVFYEAKVGEYNTVETQFGIHVVQVTDSRNSGNVGVKVAYIQEDIMPSKNTTKIANTKAFTFVSQYRTLEEMQKAAEEDPELTFRTTNELKAADYSILGLGAGSSSRDIVKWLYQAKIGEVSEQIYTYQDDELYFDSKYAIVALNSKQSTGTPSVDELRSTVEPLVRNQKKAEKIISQIKEGHNLDAIAAQFQSSVQEANGINFSQAFVQGMGNEPEVIGQIFRATTELNTTMKPVAGNSGVFVVQPIFKSEAQPITDFAATKKSISSNTKTRAQTAVFQALKDKTKITDKRAKFY